MPFVRVETNRKVDEQTAATFVADLSGLAARLLGKPEEYVMVHLHPGQAMGFAGTADPLAFVEVKSIGLATAQTPALSRSLCSFLEDRLGITPERIFIEFSPVPATLWGWKGSTF